jgi:hypothetical protein
VIAAFRSKLSVLPAGKAGNPTEYAGNDPQIMATLRNLAISLLFLSDATESPAPSRSAHAIRTACLTTTDMRLRPQATLAIRDEHPAQVQSPWTAASAIGMPARTTSEYLHPDT